MADDADGHFYCGDPDCPCGDVPDDVAGPAEDYAWRDGRAVPVETVPDIATWAVSS